MTNCFCGRPLVQIGVWLPKVCQKCRRKPFSCDCDPLTEGQLTLYGEEVKHKKPLYVNGALGGIEKMGKDDYPTYHPEKESTPNVTEGTFKLKSFDVVPSVKFGEMGRLTFADGAKAHTFSSVLIKQLKELNEAKKLPATITITRVKRYLTLS